MNFSNVNVQQAFNAWVGRFKAMSLAIANPPDYYDLYEFCYQATKNQVTVNETQLRSYLGSLANQFGGSQQDINRWMSAASTTLEAYEHAFQSGRLI